MKPDCCRHVIPGLQLELDMTPGELVMYLRGDEPPVEVYLAVLGDKDFRRLHRTYIGCKQRLAHLIETGAWERCKSKPKVLANAINPFRFCGNSLSQCAAEGAQDFTDF